MTLRMEKKQIRGKCHPFFSDVRFLEPFDWPVVSRWVLPWKFWINLTGETNL